MSPSVAVAVPIEYRSCLVCNEIHDREEMIHCLNCNTYACEKHACDCPTDTGEDAA